MMPQIRLLQLSLALETELAAAQSGPDWENRHHVIVGEVNSPHFNVDAWNAEMAEIDRRNGTRIRRRAEKKERKLAKQVDK